MEVRSYYATSVESAMELACKELGPDAMLIQARRSSPEVAHLGRYEVVFAGELQSVPSSDVRPLSAGGLGGLQPLDLIPADSSFTSLLELAGVDRAESRGFFDGEKKSPALPAHKPAPPASVKLPKTESEFACSPGLGRSGSTEAVVALVGSPGAGKTTTIMKLALTQGILVSRPVRILCFDPERIGTSERLRRFSQLFEIPFEEMETVRELSSALHVTATGLTLIDTAGYGRAETQAIASLAQCLTSHPKVEVQLVLRVDRKLADNLHVIKRFSACRPARLILTALDDASGFGDLAELVDKAAMPLSFFGVGQSIPEDLEPARELRLAGFMTAGFEAKALSAA